MCSSSYSAWCSSSCFLAFYCNSDVRFLCIEEVSPVRQPSSETRSCSSVQLFRGHHVRRTPRLQARGVFQCASVCGSQRTFLWQSGCDLCLAGSPTLGPCRHQGKSASVQTFNCFEVTAFGDPPAYDYLILLAFFFLDPDVEHVHAVFQADAAVLFPAGRQSCSETTPAPTSNNKKHQRCDVTRIITNLDTPIHTLALSCYLLFAG